MGKLGCAICLIGSVIIVLHAPPDEEVSTIDEILNYAIQPGMQPEYFLEVIRGTDNGFRLLILLSVCCYLCTRDDLWNSTALWKVESPDIHIHLLDSWLGICHGDQGIRNCVEAYPWWEQSIYSPIDICLYHCCCSMYPYTDELLQQSPEPVFYIIVCLTFLYMTGITSKLTSI